MAFIEASLEELPVSANLGQSCLATKISAAPGDADSFSAFRIDMWWKFEFLDEVSELSPPIFFDH